MPQLWAGRMRRDAFDALKYGCTGLMGIHWRTRILGPNVSALAKAAWDQKGWSEAAPASPEGAGRYLPVADFYADWARSGVRPGGGRADRRDLHSAGWPHAAAGRLGDRSRQHPARRTPLGRSAKGIRLCRRVGGLAAADRRAGQSRTLRLLVEQLPLPSLDCRGALRLGPIQRGPGQGQGRKGSAGAEEARTGTGLAGKERTGGDLRRNAPPPAGHRHQPRRDGQRVQLAAADAAGALDRARPGVGQTAGRGLAGRRHAVESSTRANRGCSCPRSARASWPARRSG